MSSEQFGTYANYDIEREAEARELILANQRITARELSLTRKPLEAPQIIVKRDVMQEDGTLANTIGWKQRWSKPTH